jgi:HD-GYP domain-containing protein (c-di-GMP phosphodiesterase class II)
VRCHDERWDGTGYPDRLAKDETPLLARIVSVADAFDAMTSPRPYYPNRQGRPASAAFDELEKQAGRQFDPRCAAAFLEMRDQVVRTMAELMPDDAQVTHASAGAATIVNINTPPPIALDSSISAEYPFL